MTWCWACDHLTRGRSCWYCDAPAWNGIVRSGGYAGPGVYVVESDCGLVKIGRSSIDAVGRVNALANDAHPDARLSIGASLPGASFEVETWLHHAFSETRDPRWAQAEGLPCVTEWFWSTPALRALIAGEAFVDLLAPEFIA